MELRASLINMEEKYAIVKFKDENGDLIYNIVMMEFLTPFDATEYRNKNLENPEKYIIIRYFC